MRHRALTPLPPCFALGLGLATGATAQMNPRGEAKVTLAGKPIVVDYGRPSLKGRDMLGKATVGQEWRMGADTATTLKTPVALSFGSTQVPPGEYALRAKKVSRHRLGAQAGEGRPGRGRGPAAVQRAREERGDVHHRPRRGEGPGRVPHVVGQPGAGRALQREVAPPRRRPGVRRIRAGRDPPAPCGPARARAAGRRAPPSTSTAGPGWRPGAARRPRRSGAGRGASDAPPRPARTPARRGAARPSCSSACASAGSRRTALSRAARARAGSDTSW